MDYLYTLAHCIDFDNGTVPDDWTEEFVAQVIIDSLRAIESTTQSDSFGARMDYGKVATITRLGIEKRVDQKPKPQIFPEHRIASGWVVNVCFINTEDADEYGGVDFPKMPEDIHDGHWSNSLWVSLSPWPVHFNKAFNPILMPGIIEEIQVPLPHAGLYFADNITN